MRRVLAVLFLIGLFAAPTQAMAGTAEDPDFVDVCAGAQDGWTSNVEWVDICRGWIDVSDDKLSFTMELESAEDAPAPMDFMASWAVDGCFYSISTSEADVLPVSQVPPAPRAAAGFGVNCGSEPCDNGVPQCFQPERSESVELNPADVLTKTGNRVTLTIDLGSEALAAYTDALAPGTTLTTTYIVASMGAERLGPDACVEGGCTSPFIDGSFGRDFTIPEPEEAA